jgi:hypothetical protein
MNLSRKQAHLSSRELTQPPLKLKKPIPFRAMLFPSSGGRDQYICAHEPRPHNRGSSPEGVHLCVATKVLASTPTVHEAMA